MAEYKGKEFIYALVVPGDVDNTIVRPFNQTSGEWNVEAETLELDSKDKNDIDYSGKVTRTVSLEGIFTPNDEAIGAIETAMDAGDKVKFYKINTRTKEAVSGLVVVTSFSESFGNGEYVTYSLEGTISGALTTETLVTVPAGA